MAGDADMMMPPVVVTRRKRLIAVADTPELPPVPIPTATVTTSVGAGRRAAVKAWLLTAWAKFLRFLTFFGLGAIISAAHIDPDTTRSPSRRAARSSTAVVQVLVSNLIAISIAGTLCRPALPLWMRSLFACDAVR